MMIIGWWMELARAGAPEALASCDEQAIWYAAQTRPNPSSRPTLWWLEKTPPCDYPLHAKGDPPPVGHEISCVDPRDRRMSWQTVFAPDGKVILETHWFANHEIGPRLEWDPATYSLLRRSAVLGGKLNGESVEWLADGGVVIIGYRHGIRSGPTWRLDERNHVLLIESWRGGKREGRTCAWRDDAWVEQVWKSGEPISDRGGEGGATSAAADARVVP